MGQNEALGRLVDGITPKEAIALLDSLRWRPGQVVTNHFGDRVFLKAAIEAGRQIGVTECCFVDDPCPLHKPKEKNDDEA